MNKFIHKLTSRKFWLALSAMVGGYILLFGGNSDLADKIGGCLLSTGAVFGYLLGEGLADSNNENGGSDDV